MRLTITATESLTTLDGRPVRIWDGRTESGARCFVFVALVSVEEGQDTAEFDRRLCGVADPRAIEPDDVPDLARHWTPPGDRS